MIQINLIKGVVSEEKLKIYNEAKKKAIEEKRIKEKLEDKLYYLKPDEKIDAYGIRDGKLFLKLNNEGLKELVKLKGGKIIEPKISEESLKLMALADGRTTVEEFKKLFGDAVTSDMQFKINSISLIEYKDDNLSYNIEKSFEKTDSITASVSINLDIPAYLYSFQRERLGEILEYKTELTDFILNAFHKNNIYAKKEREWVINLGNHRYVVFFNDKFLYLSSDYNFNRENITSEPELLKEELNLTGNFVSIIYNTLNRLFKPSIDIKKELAIDTDIKKPRFKKSGLVEKHKDVTVSFKKGILQKGDLIWRSKQKSEEKFTLDHIIETDTIKRLYSVKEESRRVIVDISPHLNLYLFKTYNREFKTYNVNTFLIIKDVNNEWGEYAFKKFGELFMHKDAFMDFIVNSLQRHGIFAQRIDKTKIDLGNGRLLGYHGVFFEYKSNEYNLTINGDPEELELIREEFNLAFVTMYFIKNIIRYFIEHPRVKVEDKLFKPYKVNEIPREVKSNLLEKYKNSFATELANREFNFKLRSHYDTCINDFLGGSRELPKIQH